MTHVVLLAGRSGGGKTYCANASGLPVLHLDSFFRPRNDGLPSWLGDINWESMESYDVAAACGAIELALSKDYIAHPVYDLSTDTITGFAEVDLNGSSTFIAEGVFAGVVFDALRSTGHAPSLLYLVHGRVSCAVARIGRDRREQRLPIIRSIAVALRLTLHQPAPQRPRPEAVRTTRRRFGEDLASLLAARAASGCSDAE